MTIKNEFKGSKIYIGSLGRKIEVTVENATLLMQHGIDYVFNFNDTKKEVKNATITKSKREPTNGNAKGETNAN